MLEIFCAGFLQLAGGTSVHTVDALKKEGLIQSPNKPGRDAVIAGVAYVGYARKVLFKTLGLFKENAKFPVCLPVLVWYV